MSAEDVQHARASFHVSTSFRRRSTLDATVDTVESSFVSSNRLQQCRQACGGGPTGEYDLVGFARLG